MHTTAFVRGNQICVCVRVCVCVCVCVYVCLSSPPRLLKSIHVKQSQKRFTDFQFFIHMTLAIIIIDGLSLSYEAPCELLPRKLR